MNEFGHIHGNGCGVFFDGWGVGPFIISADGKEFRFEDSDRFGPALVTANGDICAKPYPPQRSPFWRAHRVWVRQGRRLAGDHITCIWEEPKPTTIRHMVGRHWLVVEHGEEDGREFKLLRVAPTTDGAER